MDRRRVQAYTPTPEVCLHNPYALLSLPAASIESEVENVSSFSIAKLPLIKQPKVSPLQSAAYGAGLRKTRKTSKLKKLPTIREEEPADNFAATSAQ